MTAQACYCQPDQRLQKWSRKFLPREVRVVHDSFQSNFQVKSKCAKRNNHGTRCSRVRLNRMILKTLVGGDAHGHTAAKVIEHTSEDLLDVEQGSRYSALHRIEDRKWVSSCWGAARIIARQSSTG